VSTATQLSSAALQAVLAAQRDVSEAHIEKRMAEYQARLVESWYRDAVAAPSAEEDKQRLNPLEGVVEGVRAD